MRAIIKCVIQREVHGKRLRGTPMSNITPRNGNIAKWKGENVIIFIIIMAGMAVFLRGRYLIEERRRWPVNTASPRGQCSK